MSNEWNFLTSYEASLICGLPKEVIDLLAQAGKIRGYQIEWRRRCWYWLLYKRAFSRFLKTKYAMRICPKIKKTYRRGGAGRVVF